MVYKVVFCACKFQKPLTWHMAINTAHQMSNPGVSKERINWNFQGDWEGGINPEILHGRGMDIFSDT